MKPLVKGAITVALLACSALAAAQTPTAQIAPVNTTVSAGGTASIPILVSYTATGQNGLTVGRFTVTLTPADGQNVLPSITAVKAGTAVQALSGNCDNAPCTGTDLATNPSTPSGQTVTAALLLRSSGAAGSEQGGVIGANQEIAKVNVSLPAGVANGLKYNITIASDTVNFSTAASQQVTMTAGAATLTVGETNVTLAAGTTTAYADPVNPGQFALVPTDAAFPTASATGYRNYTFGVNAQGLGSNVVQWTLTAANLDNLPADPYTDPQLAGYKGTFTTNADGTQLTYTPDPSTVKMDRALKLTFSASVPTAPNNPAPVVFVATMYPYGDVNLNGAVTSADYIRSFRWAIGSQLPVVPANADPINLAGYIGVPIQRLLADVRGVPGEALSTDFSDPWGVELQKSGQTLNVAEFNRSGHAFGNGVITGADAIWIFRKGVDSSAGKTLDPRVGGTNPVDF